MRRVAVSAGSALGAVAMLTASLPATAVPALASTACSSVTASANPPTDTGPGIMVAITGTASGCTNPLYKFWILYPNSSTWQVVQGYGANSATYNWDTSSKPPGVYRFGIWARDAGSAGTVSNQYGTWDAFTNLDYTLKAWPYTPCSPFNAGYSSSPPQQVGTVVTVSANGPNSTCPNPRYQFWIRYPNSSNWQMAHTYAASATFTWNTSGYPAGAYAFQIWARDASSPGAYQASYGSWDAYENLAYYQLTSSPCQRVSASASPSSPQAAGTAITVTGFPFGCPNPRFQFELLASGSQTWQVVQPYSANSTFNWDTTEAVNGTYRFIVKVRDTSSVGVFSNYASSWDAYASMPYTLTSTPCSSVTASSQPSGSALSGTPVTITGAATGCPSPRYQFEMLAPGSQVWQVVQAYSAASTFNWNTTGAAKGTYRFIVKARDRNSAGTSSNYASSWDAYVSIPYTLT